MCYILLAINQSKEYPFILAANRDEFYQRESAQLAFWEDNPQIAGGRDVEQGGTWMAVTKNGRFAAITNYREAVKKKDSLRSRGLLISDYLDTDIEVELFSKNLINHVNSYSGYNLIYGNLPDQLFYFSNRGNQRPVLLPEGIHSLSNHLLDTPWPKVVNGKLAFEKIIKNQASLINHSLFQLLADRRKANAAELPDTGIDVKFERLLSPIFIESEDYGTRCSSVITVDRHQKLEFTELTHNGNAEIVNNTISIDFIL